MLQVYHMNLPMRVGPTETSNRRAAWRPNSRMAMDNTVSRVCGCCVKFGGAVLAPRTSSSELCPELSEDCSQPLIHNWSALINYLVGALISPVA